MHHFTVITSFPEMFPGSLAHSLSGKALKNEEIFSLNVIDIRKFAPPPHYKIDDYPYGGGNGLLIKADILGKAIDYTVDFTIKHYKTPPNLYYLSPKGNSLNQEKIRKIITNQNIILICGRYEGIDERILAEYPIEAISIGDFVTSGGEIPALCLIDSGVRLIEGFLKNHNTLNEESFAEGDYEYLLEYPQYTKPSKWRNHKVPDILRSGHHKKIKQWNLQQSLAITKKHRPDIWAKYQEKIAKKQD